MKFNVLVRLAISGLLLAGAGNALAHHSFAAEFDAEKPIKLSGVVTKVGWTNPHVWFYINVKDEDSGKVTNWGIELGAPHLLQRRGWRRTSLTIGTLVDIEGFMSRNGTPRVSGRSVTLASTGKAPGQTLDGGSSFSQLDRDSDDAEESQEESND